MLQQQWTRAGPVFPAVPGFLNHLDGPWIDFAKIPFAFPWIIFAKIHIGYLDEILKIFIFFLDTLPAGTPPAMCRGMCARGVAIAVRIREI
jgi:hypothetical protein